MYCNDYTHAVTDTEDDEFWNEYTISIKYPAKIDVSADTIISEFKNIYPICNRKWTAGDYYQDLKEGNLRFWQYMLSFYSISNPNLCKLVEIVLGIAANTGPLERSYSKLAKICYKDRNKLSSPHMETQYKIAILKDYEFDYPAARKLMESLPTK